MAVRKIKNRELSIVLKTLDRIDKGKYSFVDKDNHKIKHKNSTGLSANISTGQSIYRMQNTLFHIHLVSDSTGETLQAMTNAALAQFKDISVKKHHWPLIRTSTQMTRVVEQINENPGLIMYTLVNKEIRSSLIDAAMDKNLVTLSVMDPVINLLGSFFGAKALRKPGLQHIMDTEYFERIDAVQYTMAHDDGQLPEDSEDADIIIVGVSRTSKTPTSIYLANKGFRTINIPFVPNCPLPDSLFKTSDKFVVGLTTSPERLVHIRTNRLRSIKENEETDYTNIDLIKEEVVACKKLCAKNKWPVIDVTRRSIEETAAAILNKYFAWKHEEKAP